jgi:predicted TIM-barrel fold metal-dependent hydrolase
VSAATTTARAPEDHDATGGPLPDRYVVVSADCHAGGSMDQYREYLEAEYTQSYDDWRGAYSNPFRDLQGSSRSRNWDTDRRNGDLEADGTVAEIIFPNTVPPFFPTGALVARPPSKDDLELRWAGLRAHNRWLADWCAQQPQRRAGIAQVFVNDLDAAIAEVRWAHEHGLRGGVLIPGVPDDTDILPYFHPEYDRFWRVCEELGMPVNYHSGSGHPDYGDAPASGAMWLIETGWFAHRAFWQVIMAGVFERFPNLTFVMTESGCSWLVEMLRMLDGFHAQMAFGRIGELKFDKDNRLPRPPSEYFKQNCYVGVSFPGAIEAKGMKKLGIENMMWGSDYPHHEGSTPFSRELLRLGFHDWPADDLQTVLGRTAAKVYGFDLDALAPIAKTVGPTVEELRVPLDGTPEGATSPGFYR